MAQTEALEALEARSDEVGDLLDEFHFDFYIENKPDAGQKVRFTRLPLPTTRWIIFTRNPRRNSKGEYTMAFVLTGTHKSNGDPRMLAHYIQVTLNFDKSVDMEPVVLQGTFSRPFQDKPFYIVSFEHYFKLQDTPDGPYLLPADKIKVHGIVKVFTEKKRPGCPHPGCGELK